MTVYVQYQVTRDDPFIDVDTELSRFCELEIRSALSHPTVATWMMYAPQNESPIPSGSFVKIWDDDYDYEGTPFSASYPQFEGFCRSSPGKHPMEVRYTAYDPTAKAASDITVMSLAYTTDGGGNVIADTRSIPRLILNVRNDADSDWAVSRDNNTNLYGAITGILQDALLPLRYFYAAPSGDQAYVTGDISGLTFYPQEKIAFENESVRQAVTRLLSTYAPSMKMHFRAGDRQWRIFDMASSPQRGYTLNATDLDDLVLSFWIDKSVEGRYTAVEFYGPQTSTDTIFSTVDGSLTRLTTDNSGTDSYLESYSDASGMHNAVAMNYWQITDPDYRVGARYLNQWTSTPAPASLTAAPAPNGGLTFFTWDVAVKVPVMEASWDGGSTWITITNPRWDFINGMVTVGNGLYVYYHSDNPPFGSTQTYFPPDHVRIKYSSLTTPLQVRYPASSFSGSAYTTENVQATLRQYHEMLAIGYERGVPVTSATRLAEYGIMAQAMHTQRSGVVYTGGFVLDGLNFDLLNLNRRVNFTGRDKDGNAKTTGWEAINAFISDVRYNFDQQTTTVLFSSDQLQLMGYSVELLMQQLHIRALQRRVEWHTQLIWGSISTPFGDRESIPAVVGAMSTPTPYYVDPALNYNPRLQYQTRQNVIHQ